MLNPCMAFAQANWSDVKPTLILGNSRGVLIIKVAENEPPTAQGTSTIVKQDGTTLVGQASGILILGFQKDRPNYVLIDAQSIERLDQDGVHLRAGATFFHADVGLTSESKTYRGISVKTVVRAVLPFYRKVGVVPENKAMAAFLLSMTCQGQGGEGFGVIQIQGGCIAYTKRIARRVEKGYLIGQVRGEGTAKMGVATSLSVTTAGGVITLPVQSIARPE